MIHAPNALSDVVGIHNDYLGKGYYSELGAQVMQEYNDVVVSGVPRQIGWLYRTVLMVGNFLSGVFSGRACLLYVATTIDW